MKKAFIALLMIVAAVSAFATGAQDSDVIKIATDATWPPMEFVNMDHEIVGYDIDMMTEIARVGEFEVEFINTAWDGIFAGLATGEYDAVISSVTITDERKETMAFSDPYINAGQVLIVPQSTMGVEQLSDLVGKEVGVQQGTTGAFAVDAVEGVVKRSFDEIGLAVADLSNGNLDAVVCDTVVAADYILQNENFNSTLKIVGEPFTDEFYGIAFGKNSEDLVEKVNTALATVLADADFMNALEDKWLR